MLNPARKIDAGEPPASREEARIRDAYERRKASGKRAYSWFDPGHLFMVQELEQRLLATLERHGMAPLSSRKILEIGCGNGHWLREFIKWGASPENLAGVDLLAERVAQAYRLTPPGVALGRGNAAQLDFADGSFDIVLQATVFTSILDSALKMQVAREMVRVLKPDGVLLWYDFRVNNPRNPDVRGIEREEIERLFSNCRVRLERITLAPPLLRAVAPYSWLGSYLLSAIPWACTHYLGTIQKLR
jgi:ubiquinone/menaquinone biosynthesis C-methylase UbiE